MTTQAEELERLRNTVARLERENERLSGELVAMERLDRRLLGEHGSQAYVLSQVLDIIAGRLPGTMTGVAMAPSPRTGVMMRLGRTPPADMAVTSLEEAISLNA